MSRTMLCLILVVLAVVSFQLVTPQAAAGPQSGSANPQSRINPAALQKHNLDLQLAVMRGVLEALGIKTLYDDPQLIISITQKVQKHVNDFIAQQPTSVNCNNENNNNSRHNETDNDGQTANTTASPATTNGGDNPNQPSTPVQPPWPIWDDANYTKAQVCALPAAAGLCRGYMPMYHYNVTTGECHQFIYGGCGGNRNRFLSVTACEEYCAQ